jgi:hypothetical protein
MQWNNVYIATIYIHPFNYYLAMLTKHDIEKYFIAEKQEALLFLIMGFIAIIIPILLYIILKTNFIKGFCIPFIIIGSIQCIVGYTIYKRSDVDRSNNVYNYDMNPSYFATTELPRMQKVNASFNWYKYAEIALLVFSFIIIFYKQQDFLQVQKSIWLGIAIALAIQSFTMLIADLVAQQRALLYTQQIEEFIQKQ